MFQNVRVIGTPVEPLFTAALEYRAFDPEHAIRGARKAIEAWEYFQSPLCARHINALGEDLRLIFSERGPRPHNGYTPRNLRNLLASASRTPHQGGWIGRDIGWAAWCAAMLFKVRGQRTGPGWKEWAKQAQALMSTMAQPTGFTERVHIVPQWSPEELDAAQAFELPIQAFGFYALSVQSGAALGDWAVTAGTQLYRVLEQVEDHWNAGCYGPFKYVFVAQHGGEPFVKLAMGQGVASDGKPGDITHKEAMCALLFRMKRDASWFDDAAMTYGIAKPKMDYLTERVLLLEHASDDPACAAAAVVVGEYQRAYREGKV